MIENNVQIRNSNISFAGKLPAKGTYSNLQKYYEGLNYYTHADFYKALDNRAKARLHLNKSSNIQNEILDFSERSSDEIRSGKDTLKAYMKMTKLSVAAVYENLLGMFYSMRK